MSQSCLGTSGAYKGSTQDHLAFHIHWKLWGLWEIQYLLVMTCSLESIQLIVHSIYWRLNYHLQNLIIAKKIVLTLAIWSCSIAISLHYCYWSPGGCLLGDFSECLSYFSKQSIWVLYVQQPKGTNQMRFSGKYKILRTF